MRLVAQRTQQDDAMSSPCWDERDKNLWMRSSPVVSASECHCASRIGPRFDPSILRYSGIRGGRWRSVEYSTWKTTPKSLLYCRKNRSMQAETAANWRREGAKSFCQLPAMLAAGFFVANSNIIKVLKRLGIADARCHQKHYVRGRINHWCINSYYRQRLFDYTNGQQRKDLMM